MRAAPGFPYCHHCESASAFGPRVTIWDLGCDVPALLVWKLWAGDRCRHLAASPVMTTGTEWGLSMSLTSEIRGRHEADRITSHLPSKLAAVIQPSPLFPLCVR